VRLEVNCEIGKRLIPLAAFKAALDEGTGLHALDLGLKVKVS
jgi:hypothetical protein